MKTRKTGSIETILANLGRDLVTGRRTVLKIIEEDPDDEVVAVAVKYFYVLSGIKKAPLPPIDRQP